MGYYINETKNGLMPALGKTEILILHEKAQEIFHAPKKFPQDKAIICVVNNGIFEAAGFAYDEKEMNAFNDPMDSRPKRWLVMNLERAKSLAGFL